MQRYLISRNSQTYGPYTLEELGRYLASGHVLASDLAHLEPGAGAPAPEPGPAWVPVSQLVPSAQSAPPGAPAYAPPLYVAPGTAAPGALSPAVEAPPNLSWGLYIFLIFITCGLFAVIYELIQAAWIRRIYPASRVLFIYIAALLCYVINIAASLGRGIIVAQTHTPGTSYGLVGGLFSLVYLVLVLVARFTMRSELEQHYNSVEPIGLSLSGVMTFFFGSIYFQYHFNRINELKRAMSFGFPAVR